MNGRIAKELSAMASKMTKLNNIKDETLFSKVAKRFYTGKEVEKEDGTKEKEVKTVIKTTKYYTGYKRTYRNFKRMWKEVGIKKIREDWRDFQCLFSTTNA